MSTPNKISYPDCSLGLLTDVDTVQRNPLGTRQFDDQGSEYIYLNGVASCVAGSFVLFGQSATPYATVALLINDANSQTAGMVAVAYAAVNATTSFGWFQIHGLTQGKEAIATTATVGGQLYRTSTAGRAAVTAVAKDCIFGAVTAAAAVANVGQAFLFYPHVTDQSTL
jgi:hypothetical protein